MALRPEFIPEHARGTQWHWLGEELVVLDPAGRMLRGFNGTGARVWELIDSRRSALCIAKLVAEEAGLPVEQVLEDVLVFLVALGEKALVQTGSGRGGES